MRSCSNHKRLSPSPCKLSCYSTTCTISTFTFSRYYNGSSSSENDRPTNTTILPITRTKPDSFKRRVYNYPYYSKTMVSIRSTLCSMLWNWRSKFKCHDRFVLCGVPFRSFKKRMQVKSNLVFVNGSSKTMKIPQAVSFPELSTEVS